MTPGSRVVAIAARLALAGGLVLAPGTWASEPRPAKVAGAFYPAEPDVLRRTVAALLDSAAPASGPAPTILIAPHAGYQFSGPVAAQAFAQIRGRAADYDAVVVVGFAHRGGFSGSSVDERDAYQTPLGLLPVDRDAAAFLRTQPGVSVDEAAHESGEHSLEVMLPFLQVALGEFRLVPVLMGGSSLAEADALARALARLAGRGRYVFVFSTDLSHYHPDEQARGMDELTIGSLLRETPQAVDRLFRSGQLEACGRGPILASLLLADRLGHLERRLLRYANSGETAGDKQSVVGYAAIGMYERGAPAPESRISNEAGAALVRAARLVLEMQLRPERYANRLVALGVEGVPELSQPRGMFVTLRAKDGALRGCIGRIQSETPMAELLPVVARDAALRDARFAPLSAEELDGVTIEVSVLTALAPVGSAEEIVAGRDGVVIQQDGRSGVFLPQVWADSGWTRLEFLRALARDKAGLDPDAWRSARLLSFQDQAFEEEPASLSVWTAH